MALNLGGAKKRTQKSSYSIIEVSLFKPTKSKYPEFDYEKLRKEQLGEEDSSEDERFHDKEALKMVRRLEAKYGNKKTKKGKKVRFGSEDDFIDKGAGYDLEDTFIDDSEAYDELIPSTIDTARGGFYVNKGPLEFKSKFEEADISDLSGVEQSPVKQTTNKGKKRALVSSDDEKAEQPDPQSAKSIVPKEVATEPKKPETSVPEPAPIQRLTGAPPTKKLARISAGTSPVQRDAEAVEKKRMTGLPPTMNKTKLAKKIFPVESESSSSSSPNCITSVKPTRPPSSALPAAPAPVTTVKVNSEPKRPCPATTPPLFTCIDVAAVLASPGPPPTADPKKIVAKGSKTPPKKDDTGDASSAETGKVAVSHQQESEKKKIIDETVVPNSTTQSTEPKKSSPLPALPPLPADLTKLISDFKEKTSSLAEPGQKKRLRRSHIDLVIGINEQASRDVKEKGVKSEIMTHLADYCGLARDTLKKKVYARKEDLKQSATASSAAEPAVSHGSAKKEEKLSSAEKKDLSEGKAQQASSSDAQLPPQSSPPKWTEANKKAATNILLTCMKVNGLSMKDSKRLEALLCAPEGSYADFMKVYEHMLAKAALKKVPATSPKKRSASLSVEKTSGSGAPSVTTKKTTPAKKDDPPSSVPLGKPAAPVVPKISLKEAVAQAKPFQWSLNPLSKQADAITVLEAQLAVFKEGVATALARSERLHATKLQKHAESETSSSPPRFLFFFSESLILNLRNCVVNVVEMSRYTAQPESIPAFVYGYVKTKCMGFFRNRVSIGRLFVEYCRRNLDHCSLLNHPPLQQDLKDEQIDIARIRVSVPSAVQSSSVPPKSPVKSAAKSEKKATDSDVQIVDEVVKSPVKTAPLSAANRHT